MFNGRKGYTDCDFQELQGPMWMDGLALHFTVLHILCLFPTVGFRTWPPRSIPHWLHFPCHHPWLLLFLPPLGEWSQEEGIPQLRVLSINFCEPLCYSSSVGSSWDFWVNPVLPCFLRSLTLVAGTSLDPLLVQLEIAVILRQFLFKNNQEERWKKNSWICVF